MEVKIKVTDDTIKSLLCSAFEGGSNYWYMVEREELAEGLEIGDFYQGGKMQDGKQYWHYLQLIPLTPGCALIITSMEEDDKKEYRLDRDAITKGIQVMADKCPCHFADILNENTDSITGDVFLQCCLFGDIIYS